MPAPYRICKTSELLPGEKRLAHLNGISIGVFNIKGEYYALRNLCPHQLAPLCEGTITGTTLPSPVGEYCWAREGEIIRCPWHGWEFDIRTGQSVFNPHKVKTRAYNVTLESDPSVETYPTSIDDQWVVVHA
jgi:3-phenylpropionate/trans-cinnamate dioxygenase ferredoxin subunit